MYPTTLDLNCGQDYSKLFEVEVVSIFSPKYFFN